MLGHLALDVKDLKAYRYQPKNANYYHNMDIPYIYIKYILYTRTTLRLK